MGMVENCSDFVYHVREFLLRELWMERFLNSVTVPNILDSLGNYKNSVKDGESHGRSDDVVAPILSDIYMSCMENFLMA